MDSQSPHQRWNGGAFSRDRERAAPSAGHELIYLRPGTKIEPLVCRWYAWPHLIPPAQLALNLAFRYIPILKSFAASPSAHMAAAKDPAFLGAPFANLTGDDVGAVLDLIRDTGTRCGALIEFANSLIALDRRLQQGARGFSLNEFYVSLPASLQGLVELTYDLNDHASVRVLDELMLSEGICPSRCHEIMLFSAPDRERDFFLNTPRLNRAGRVFLSVPFSDRRFDLLSRSRIAPVSYREMSDAFDIPPESVNDFRKLFTTDPPSRNMPEYHGPDVRLRYFGHACILIQTAAISILIDPTLAWESDTPEASLTFSDLPDHIDFVFITHNHQDHFVPEVFLQLRNRIGRILVPRNNASNVADPSIRLTLKHLGFENVDVLDPLDERHFTDGFLVSLPFYGEHADLSISTKQGMYLQVKGRPFMFLADADCVDPMLYRRLIARFGKVDTLFIGMECRGAPLSWLYGAYMSRPVARRNDESRRLSGSDAARAAAVFAEVGCKWVFVYAMGQEPWLRHLLGLQYSAGDMQIVESDKFVQHCREAGAVAERLYGCREFLF